MADMNEIVRLAVDAYHGTTTKYSKSESMDTLRQAIQLTIGVEHGIRRCAELQNHDSVG